jgi:hypothetical protein
MNARLVLPAVAVALAAALSAGPAARANVDDEDPAPPTPAAIAPAVTRLPPAATPAPVPDRPRSTAIYTIVGFGTPVGFVGVEAVHRFAPWLEVGAGVGSGLAAAGSKHNPLQWSVMPRLRLGDEHQALTLGAGLSGGNYGDIPLDFDCESDCNANAGYPVRYVVWGNVELGLELWKRGFAFRAFGGYARGCTTDGCGGSADGAPLGIPYFGLGFGYAF